MFASGKVRVQKPETNNETIIKGEAVRIDQFQSEMIKFGTLKGFSHFMAHLRTRDELIIKIFKSETGKTNITIPKTNPDSGSETLSTKKTLLEARPRAHVNSYLVAENAPKTSVSKATLEKLERARKDQKSRFYQYTAWEGLPISEKQTHEDQTKSAFMMGAYSVRSVPMVWILADHHSFNSNPPPGPTKPIDLEDEDPLILDSISSWYEKNITFVDVIFEIITKALSMSDSLTNPFEINFDYLNHLPTEETLYIIPSLVEFLSKVLTIECLFNEKIIQNIEELFSLQINCIDTLAVAPRDSNN